MNFFENVVGPTEVSLVIDLALSLAAGFIIGTERESKGKDAGVTTYTMVIVGSMLFTFISSLVDPASESRIAAQIVSGIGFLGAGLIIRDGANVKNLTTAASVWLAGAIGMAFGFNFHFIGILTTLVVAFVIPRLPHLYKKSPESIIENRN